MGSTIMVKIATILVSSLLVCYALAGCKVSPPEADFTGTPATSQVPAEVQFTDLSVGDIDAWRWDFNNDGVVDSVLQSPQYAYAEAGTYTVSLTVSNSHGSDYETKIGYLHFTLPCKVDFTAEPTKVVGVTEIQFTDLSEGEITSWAWDFNNDGIIDSTEQNPTHTYGGNGIYTVTLTVTGPNCELSVTKEHYIRVSGCSG